MKFAVSAAICIFAVLLFLCAPPESLAQQQNKKITYSTDIAPILQTRCVNCHGAARPAAGLRLDTYQGLMAGSKDRPVIVPGNPQQSLFVKMITGTAKPRMPKNGPPWLSDGQITLIEDWIASGAEQ